jgi:hypothetical protein
MSNGTSMSNRMNGMNYPNRLAPLEVSAEQDERPNDTKAPPGSSGRHLSVSGVASREGGEGHAPPGSGEVRMGGADFVG